MLKTIASLRGVTVLSKEAQKKINGGQSCTYTWQDGNGIWHTEQGQCSIDASSPNHWWQTEFTAYCHTPHHTSPTTLSSNGGTSRCFS